MRQGARDGMTCCQTRAPVGASHSDATHAHDRDDVVTQLATVQRLDHATGSPTGAGSVPSANASCREHGDAGGYAATGISSTSRSSSGATGSVSSADKGRNDEVLCRVQSQCSSLGLSRVNVPNKVRNDRLAVAISLTVMRDQVPVVHDVRAQFRQCLDQFREAGIGLAEGLDHALQIINLA